MRSRRLQINTQGRNQTKIIRGRGAPVRFGFRTSDAVPHEREIEFESFADLKLQRRYRVVRVVSSIDLSSDVVFIGWFAARIALSAQAQYSFEFRSFRAFENQTIGPALRQPA